MIARRTLAFGVIISGWVASLWFVFSAPRPCADACDPTTCSAVCVVEFPTVRTAVGAIVAISMTLASLLWLGHPEARRGGSSH